MPEIDPKQFKPIWQIPFEGAWPTTVAFLDSHRRLVAGNRNGQLIEWELPERADSKLEPRPSRQYAGHENGITRLVATDGGKRLISASLDRTARFWDADAASSGQAEVVLDIEQRRRQAKKERKDDALKKPGAKVATLAAARVIDDHSDWVTGLGVSRGGERMITGDDAGLSIVWDLPAGKEVARWKGHPMTGVCSAAVSPDGKTAFVAEFRASRGSFDRPPAQARFYDAATGEMKLDVLAVQFPKVKARDNSYGYASTWRKFVGRGFVCADFSPDGKLLAVGQGGETGTGKVHLIEVATGKVTRSVSGHKYGVVAVRFSPDGKYVLSGGRDTTVRICQTADGKEVANLGKSRGGQFKDWMHDIAISADGKWLAAADIAGIVHVWSSEG